MSTADRGSGTGLLAIVGATVIDGSEQEPSPNTSILIRGDRIAAVGPTGSIEIPDGSHVVDATGRTVIPGLIDLHVHSTFPAEMRGYIARGVTSIRFAGIDQPAFRRVQQGIASGAFPGPRVFTLGPMLDTPPGSWPEWTNFVTSVDEARAAAVRLLDQEQTDGLIVTQGITPDLMDAVIGAAHDRARPVMGQIWWTDGAEAAALGIDQLDNTSRIAASRDWTGPRLFDYRSVPERIVILSRLWTSVDWSATERLMDVMREADVAYCPTLVTTEQQAGQAHGVIEGDPLFAALFGPEEHAAWAAFKARVGGTWTADEMALWRASIDPRYEWMRRYRDRGGRILAGTDMQFGGIALHRELELLREVGYSPLELIRIATAGAARAMAVQDGIGTIEPGRMADLVVLAGDPSRDLAALRAIETVMIGGVVVEGSLAGSPGPS